VLYTAKAGGPFRTSTNCSFQVHGKILCKKKAGELVKSLHELLKEMETTAVIGSIASHTLDLPPSCVEFSKQHPHLFVVGCYSLEKAEAPELAQEDTNETKKNEKDHELTTEQRERQKRTGSLILFQWDDTGL
jgi:hypothetical protein